MAKAPEFSVSKLAELTGKAPRTITAKLKEHKVKYKVVGKAHMYNSKEALEAIYLDKDHGEDQLDPIQERAKVDNQRWRKIRVERKKLEKELVEARLIKYAFSNMVIGLRTRLLAIPVKVAGVVFGMDSREEIAEAITREIETAMTTIAVDQSFIEQILEDE